MEKKELKEELAAFVVKTLKKETATEAQLVAATAIAVRLLDEAYLSR